MSAGLVSLLVQYFEAHEVAAQAITADKFALAMAIANEAAANLRAMRGKGTLSAVDPDAFAIYTPEWQNEELVHQLDDAVELLTNNKTEVTRLYRWE